MSLPPPAVGDNDVVAAPASGCQSSPPPAESSATAASAGDSGNYDNEANKLSPQAGTDANGGGRR